MGSGNVQPFHERLRQLLRERGISHNQYERETGMSRGVLYPREYRPTRSLLMALAYYFGITVEELVEGTDAFYDWHYRELER